MYRWLTPLSQQFLEKDYLLEGQSVDDRVNIICNAAEQILGIPGFAARFKDNFQKGWYSLSTPIWTNFGTDRGLPISCFGSYIEDNMASILYTQAEVGMMSKYGGGTSAYAGNLRSRGSDIKNNGKSSGAVHFGQLYNANVNVISQGSARRGSFAYYLPIYHGDIEEFLTIKTEGSPLQDISFAVCVPDWWMKEMIAGDKGKRRIWAKVLETRANIGYPYILFTDNANNGKPDVYKDKGMEIVASNLCVAPETQILTSAGYFPIAELEGDIVEVWNGKQWSKTQVVKTGENQKLITVNFSNGQSIDCTEYHKFYIQRGYNQGTGDKKIVIEEKRASDLQVGDKIIKCDFPIIDFEDDFPDAYTQGVFSGDGCRYDDVNHIDLYGEKIDLIPFRVNKIYQKFTVPHLYSIKSRLKWFAGLCDADGCLLNNNGTQSIQIGSIHRAFLGEVQLMLQTLGVNSKVLDAREECDRLMPDGRGGNKEYHCQKAYRLCIGADALFNLIQLGFAPNRLQLHDNKPNRNAEQFVKVVSIEDNGRYDDTYCVNEPLEHKVVFNGVITGNCNEIMLPSNADESFVCDLSSMNILHFDEWKDTDAVELLTFLLDAVMEEFIVKAEKIPFMDRAVRFAKRHRALGIGWLGWHSYLQSKMIPWESMEAKLLNVKVAQTIKEQSYAASAKLAEMFGEPEVLKGYGRRNTTLMAIAPTKSSAFILGQVSEGIEPHRANYYIKDLAKGKFTIKNHELEQLLEEKDKNNEDVWMSILKNSGSVQHLDFLSDHEKSVFKTFSEISPKEIIIQAAQRQRYIDQGQSLNLMIHPTIPIKDVNQLLIEGWEMGIKGYYYQHSINSAQNFARSILNCVSCEA